MTPARLRTAGSLSVVGLLGASVLLTGAALGTGDPYVTGGSRASGWLLGPLRFCENGLGRDGIFLAATAMLVAYLVLLRSAAALGSRAVLATIAVLHAWFIAGPLLFSGDVIFYVGLGRLWALDGLDPYAFGRLAGEQARVVSAYTGIWGLLSSTYGPVFIVASGGAALLGVAGSVWAFKLAVGAGAVATLWLTARIAERLGRDPVLAVAFVGANPIWLAWVVGGAHNDTLVMAGLMAAVLLVLRGAEGRAGAALGVVAAIKLSVVPFAAFLLVGARHRGRLLAGGGLAAAAGLALGFALFPGSWLGSWLRQTQDQAVIAGPGPLTWLMGFLRFESTPVPLGVRSASQSIGLLIVVALLLRAWRRATWLTDAGWAALALLVLSAWLREWYLAWLLPLAALSPSRRLAAATLALTAFVLLTSDKWLLDVIFLRLL